MNIPFFKQFKPSLLIHAAAANPWTYALGAAPFCLFVALVVVFSSNAVNLTDGLDGLAIGLMVIAAGALTMLTYAGGHAQLAEYLQLARNPRTSGADRFLRLDDRRQPGIPVVQRASRGDFHGRRGLARIGRRHGGGGGADQAGVLLLFIGGVFMLEAVSVILQVGSYQVCGTASAFSRWRPCTIISSVGLGGIEKVIARFGLPAWCWHCSH
jgi:phospho-N-acetylmuramoyl-pentapeptide-transferase